MPSGLSPLPALLLLLLSHFSHVRLSATPQMAATRLPRPWDSPGKNTGVGCHFLLQCRKVKSESEVAQLCPTLSDPMDCNLPSSKEGSCSFCGAKHFVTNVNTSLLPSTLSVSLETGLGFAWPKQVQGWSNLSTNAELFPELLLRAGSDQIRSDQSLSRVWLFATPWIAARQASLSITNSQSSFRLTSIKSVMPSSHLILCRPLLLLPPIQVNTA